MNKVTPGEQYMHRKVNRIHMVGIGGIGMSGIAELLLNLGYEISGSDVSSSGVVERLMQLGAKIIIGHRAENIGNADLIVVSSAIKPENEELLAAREKQIPIIQRAEMLAELMRLKYGIAVAGAHGKTTTTSMIAMMLADAGKDPTMVIGGRLIAIGTNAKLGQGDIIVVEADESDKSFLRLFPIFVVITNIDREHLDTYHSLEDISKTFLEFMNKVPFYGAIIACSDDQVVKELVSSIDKKVIRYGLDPAADFVAVNISAHEFSSDYTLIYKGKDIGNVKLNVPGIHNIKNSLAAIAISHHLDIPFEQIITSLLNFQGVERRFQLKAKSNSVYLIDDYAHHPTEINAVLQAARSGWSKKIITIFQPHRYTRTYHLMNEFCDVLSQSDSIVIADIYAASEKPIEGVSSSVLVDCIKKRGHTACYYVPKLEDIPALIKQLVCKDTMIITVGAGNISKIHNQLIEIVKSFEQT